jgi:hypothetical protein
VSYNADLDILGISLLPVPGIELRFISRPSCNLTLAQTVLSCFLQMLYAIHGIHVLELEPAYCSLCEKTVSMREGCIKHITWLKLAMFYTFFWSIIALRGLKKNRLSHILCSYVLQLGKSEINLKHPKFEKQVTNEA